MPGGLMGGKDCRFKHDKSTTHEEMARARTTGTPASVPTLLICGQAGRAAAGFGTKTAQRPAVHAVRHRNGPGRGRTTPPAWPRARVRASKRSGHRRRLAGSAARQRREQIGDRGRTSRTRTRSARRRRSRRPAWRARLRSLRRALGACLGSRSTQSGQGRTIRRARSIPYKKMPSSSFRSSSAQRMKEHNHYTPSPGAYDVRKQAVEARVPGGLMGGKDGRFKHDKSTTHEEIGPGARLGRRPQRGRRPVCGQAEPSRRAGTKPRSTTCRSRRPAPDGPGPGSYNTAGMATMPACASRRRPSSAFKSE